jgi:transmembrane sensor
MNMDEILTLLRAHLEGTLGPEEKLLLDEWIAQSPERRVFFEQLNDPDRLLSDLQRMDSYSETAVWEKIEVGRQKKVARMRSLFIRRRVGWAAAVLVLLGTGGWWMSRTRTKSGAPVLVATRTADVAAPAASRATITLAGGREVALDSVARGALAEQGGARVVKDAKGEVAYQLNLHHPDELLFNTLTNPRGSPVVTLTLSDGTKVWLNAESSIRYPAVFVGSDRSVEMTGEAYFEVAHDAGKPFWLTVGGETIDVLGTGFNVNAYTDEKVLRTTLVEGAIAVSAGGKRERLKPGEQTTVGGGGAGISAPAPADLEQVLAWKNGLFAFAHTDLPGVLQELGRWYDVDISYSGKIPERHFSGRIDRSLTLDQVLKILTRTRVSYTIVPGARNKLIIRP